MGFELSMIRGTSMKKTFFSLTGLIVLFASLSGCSLLGLDGKPSSSATASGSPNNSSNALTLGNEAMATKDYDNAVQDYQNAANANPNSAAAYQGLGTAYYYLGQKDQAVSAYQKALQLDPSNTRLSNFVAKLTGSNTGGN
jgi:tetratricopeptide (TPR) repeat protein